MSKKFIETALLSLVSVFAPIKSILAAVLVMVIVDMITGMLAARKRGEPVTSASMRRSISKLFIYEACLISAFITETYLLSGIMPVVKMAASLIGITELKSCLENLNELNGGNLFKTLITALGSKNDAITKQSD